MKKLILGALAALLTQSVFAATQQLSLEIKHNDKVLGKHASAYQVGTPIALSSTTELHYIKHICAKSAETDVLRTGVTASVNPVSSDERGTFMDVSFEVTELERGFPVVPPAECAMQTPETRTIKTASGVRLRAGEGFEWVSNDGLDRYSFVVRVTSAEGPGQ